MPAQWLRQACAQWLREGFADAAGASGMHRSIREDRQAIAGVGRCAAVACAARLSDSPDHWVAAAGDAAGERTAAGIAGGNLS
jgi:hypothetical protein